MYGGGNITAYTPDSRVTAVGTDRITPEVNIIHGTVLNNVYGGGLGTTATVHANPVVTIGDNNNSHKAIVAHDVYGGGDAVTRHRWMATPWWFTTTTMP